MGIMEQAGTAPDNSVQSPRTWPEIAGFWWRLGAAALDCLLIAVVGQMIALPFTGFWSGIGPDGRFVGIAIVLLYFGVLNSWIGSGQTVGKRLLKIAVRGADNQPISLGRSLVRISILAAPFLLYGWAVPFLQAPGMSWLTGLLVLGLGAAIAYTMVLNVEARQGLHDLICGTYVVDTNGILVDEFPRSDRIHWIISGALLGLATLVVAAWNALPPPLEVRAALQDIRGLQQALKADPRFFTASANVTAMYVSTLDVEVWNRGVLTEPEQRQLRLDLARMAMQNAERVYQFDYLTVSVRSAYDLGIAAGHVTSEEIHWISAWRRILANNPAP